MISIGVVGQIENKEPGVCTEHDELVSHGQNAFHAGIESSFQLKKEILVQDGLFFIRHEVAGFVVVDEPCSIVMLQKLSYVLLCPEQPGKTVVNPEFVIAFGVIINSGIGCKYNFLVPPKHVDI